MFEKPDFERCRALYEENIERFARFMDLLLDANKRYNLTAITKPDEVYYKHFLDSLAGEYLFPQGAKVAEVGSGGGFPSVPIMIARPDLSFTLIESKDKKCKFLQQAIALLGLNAKVICGRAEDVGRGQWRGRFDVVCARAVAPLEKLAEYCIPLVKMGGNFIAYKGYPERADNIIGYLGCEKAEYIEYCLPDGYGERTLIVAKKKRRTPNTYPHPSGTEVKIPKLPRNMKRKT